MNVFYFEEVKNIIDIKVCVFTFTTMTSVAEYECFVIRCQKYSCFIIREGSKANCNFFSIVYPRQSDSGLCFGFC